MYLFKKHPNAEAIVYGFLMISISFFHLFYLSILLLVVQLIFLCIGKRAGIKEYQFTYTVLIECNKIPPKDIINVFVLALTLENLSE